MLKRRFEWKDNSKFGAGWVPAWNEHLDSPVSGLNAAHDVLEHFPKLGGMQGEMMAFGAMHFVRGDNWNWGQRGIFEAQMVDIAYELVEATWKDELPKSPGRSILSQDVIDSDCLRKMVRKAVITAIRDMVDDTGIGETIGHNRAHYRRMMGGNIAQRIEGWIVKGAVAAERRYTRMGQSQKWRMSELFDMIKRNFNQVAKFNGEQGEFIDVMVDVRDIKVTVKRGDIYHTDE